MTLYGQHLLIPYEVWNQKNYFRQTSILFNHVTFLVVWACPKKFLGLPGCINQFFFGFFVKLISWKSCQKLDIIFSRNDFLNQTSYLLFPNIYRESSDYLQHSVLSSKRFGQLERKLEQKAWPLPRMWDPGGVRGVPQRT